MSGVFRLGAVVPTIGPRIEGLGFNSLRCDDRWLLRAVAPARLGQVPRSSDRHSTVVLNVARRHRASQIKPGRQGRGSRRAWPGGAMCRTRSEVCWPEQGSLAGFGADDEPEKLQMVRRRSTVRFRKGAPRSGPFFESEPVIYSDGRNRSGFAELRGCVTAQAHGGLWQRVGAGERALLGGSPGARSSLGRLRSTPKAPQFFGFDWPALKPAQVSAVRGEPPR